MAIKGSVLEVFTQTKRTDICFACAFDDMFSGFNTARKAVWLTLAPLEYASDRKDSQMLLHSIRESKTKEGTEYRINQKSNSYYQVVQMMMKDFQSRFKPLKVVCRSSRAITRRIVVP